MKNKDLSLNITVEAIKKPLVSFIRRFHTIMFFLFISIALFISITLLMSFINISSSTATNSSQAINTTFDQQTIDRINDLGNNSSSKPGQRSNPFIE